MNTRFQSLALALTLIVPQLSAGPARIMPLGDSITRGTNDINFPNGSIPGGYRRGLGDQLAAAGFSYDFVGNNSDNAFPGMDPDHNGNNGFRTDQILANLTNWLTVSPDTVLLHAGTNDILQDVPVATAIANLGSIIDAITGNAPSRRLYVATIIPITQDWQGRTAAYLNGNANSYNTQLRSLVQQFAAQGRTVYVVEMNARIVLTNPNPALNFYQPGDGIHPGQAGYNQMAAIWYDSVTASGSLLPDPYQAWAMSYPDFMALPAAERTPGADPNHDGSSNLLAYAAGVDPLGAFPAPIMSASAPEASFRFRRNKTSDVTFEVVVSSDLRAGSWQIQDQSGATITPIAGEPGVENVSVPLGTGGRKFARLRVTRN